MIKAKNLFMCGVLSLSLLLSLSACGGGNTASSNGGSSDSAVEEAPLDLTGSWAQKGKEGSESFQACYINDDTIEVFWITDNGDSHMLYWAGTYDAPTSSEDAYSWSSVNDKTKTDSALMASGDDTKTFDYKKGEISYEVSMMGETGTVTLVRSDNDYSSFVATGGTSGAAQDGKQIELVDSGYSIVPSGDYTYVYYAVTIKNPNEEYAIEFPEIMVTAKAEDGSILETENQTLNSIAANDTITYANYAMYEGAPADKVDISVRNDDNNYMHQEGSGVIRADDLAVSNTSENKGSYDTKFTGEVSNNSTVDLDMAGIVVVLKNEGKLVGGYTTYIDNLKSGTSLPFDLSISNDVTYDAYEIHAIQW